MEYNVLINGFETTAVYDEYDIENIFEPIIKKLIELQKSKNKRIIVFLSAPQAVGKSTLVACLEKISKERLNCDEVQGIGIDGFHFYNDYLIENNLKKIKGSLMTFDIKKLESSLNKVKDNDIYWPIYDRNLHNPIEDAILVNKKIIILEGNYLSHSKWENLKKYCDVNIFITAHKEILKDRLIARKIKGGLTEEEAIKFYEASDEKNIDEVLENSINADIELIYDGYNYKITRGGI